MHQAFFCSFILTLMGIQFMEADPPIGNIKNINVCD